MGNFKFDPSSTFARIKVIGIGGAGSNAVNRMIDDMKNSIDYIVMNTDAQALSTSCCKNQFVLGEDITRGLGAGGNPEVGKKAALADLEKIKEMVSNTDLVFIAAGMGGGTGTGAAPVVAKAAMEAGALTIAVVTRPFDFEGQQRKVKAIEGINELKKYVDSYIVVSNNSLMNTNGDRPIGEAFAESDRILSQSVKTITDLIILPGLINLDFNDIKNTLSGKRGMALIGFGMGSGEKKAIDAASNSFSSPLLEASIKGARSAIVNITGGKNVTLSEAADAIDYIREVAENNIEIIFGVQQNPILEDTMLISIIATGFDSDYDFSDSKPLISTRAKTESKESSSPITNNLKKSENKEEESILPSFLNEIRRKNETNVYSFKEEEKTEENDDIEQEGLIDNN